VRRLSLKDNSTSKDGKTPTPRDLITASTDSTDGLSNSAKKSSVNSTSSKIKV